MSKISLPSVPRSADRDTTVFLQSLKKAVEGLSAKDLADLSDAARSYVLALNKRTEETLIDVIGTEAGVGAILDKIKGSITESQLSIDLGKRVAKIETNETAISTESQTRMAEMLAANERISTETTLRQDADGELLTQIDILLTATGENRASIVEETRVRTSLTDAHASRLTALDTKTDTANAHIGTLQTATATNKSAIATSKTELRAEFAAGDAVNKAAIDSESTARTNAVSALSKTVDTVQATANGNTSSIQTQSTAIAGINTKLSATWSVKADVNGVVGGIALGNDGKTVDFIVRASSFAIQGQSGSKSVPFVSYPDGTVIDGVPIPAGNYLEDTYIRRASIDTLDIKGNAVTVPVSAFTEASIAIGTNYTTIQSLAVPADMGHTMLNFNAIFNFPGYARKQSILCRIVKGGLVIADNIEVFFSEARSASRATSAVDASGHNHSGGFQGSAYVNGQYINIGGPVTIGYTSLGGHSHNIDVANDNRNAGSFSLSRHDSTGVAGTYQLQMRVADGGTANLSQRYIHAMTMRR